MVVFSWNKVENKQKDYLHAKITKRRCCFFKQSTFFSSELFAKDGERCGYLNFEDEEILQKMDDVTETMSALK